MVLDISTLRTNDRDDECIGLNLKHFFINFRYILTFMKEAILENLVDDDPQEAMEDYGAKVLKFFNYLQRMFDENKQLRQRVAEQGEKIAKLEGALEEQKKNDDWSSRVTYDGVVEQIAACEDAKERDEARKLIEPLLKRAQVTLFRRDIKRRVKELNDEQGNGGSTFNNYGSYTEVHAGGVNINNKKEDAGH